MYSIIEKQKNFAGLASPFLGHHLLWFHFSLSENTNETRLTEWTLEIIKNIKAIQNTSKVKKKNLTPIYM